MCFFNLHVVPNSSWRPQDCHWFSANCYKSNILSANVKAPPLLVLSAILCSFPRDVNTHILENPVSVISALALVVVTQFWPAWNGFVSQNILRSQISQFLPKRFSSEIGREIRREKSSSKHCGVDLLL